MPGERQASVRAATRELAPVDIGLDDDAVAKLIRPYLPDRLITRDLHVVLDENVDPGSVPGLTETVAVEDLLHEDRADLVCGVVRSVSWADLAFVSGRGKWSVLRCRPRRGKAAAPVTVEPAEHLRRLSLHMLESLPTTKGALVVGHSDLVDRKESYLLGHWRVGEQETYLVSLPAGQALIDTLRETGEHEIRMVKPAFSPRTGKKTAGNQPVHRVLATPPKAIGSGKAKTKPSKQEERTAAPAEAAARRGRGRQAGRQHRDAQATGGGRKGGDRAAGPGAPPTIEPPRRRVVTRRRVLVAGVSSTAVLGGAGVGLLLGGVAAAVAVAAGLWLAGATAVLMVLLLRNLDTVRRVEESGQSSARRIRKVVETEAGRTLREARRARTEERELVDAQHRQLADDITRNVNEQHRTETKRATSAVLSGVSDSAASTAESIGRLITQLRDRLSPLESLAGLDARMSASHANLREDLRAAFSAAAGQQGEALDRTSRQVADSTREQEAQLRRLATDYEREVREAERRLVDVITSRLAEEHRGETRRAVSELLDGLVRTSQAGTERVSGLVAGLDDRVSALSGPLNTVDGRVAGLEPQLAELDRQMSRAHEELREQVNARTAASTEQVLAGVLEASQRTSAEIGEAVSGLGERVTGLEGPLSGIDERVASLQGPLSAVESRVAASQDELAEQVRSSTAASSERVLAGVREASERTSAEVGEAAAGLGERVTGLKGPLLGIDERVSGLVAPLSALDERVGGLEAPLSALDERVAGLERPLSRVDKRVAGLEAPLSALDERLAGLEAPLSGIDERVGGLVAPLSALDERVAGLERPLSRVDKRVAGLQAPLSAIDERVAKIHEELGETVRASTTSSTEQVLAGLREMSERTSAEVGEATAGLSERVAGLGTPLSAVDERVAGLQGPLSAIEERVAAMEGPLSAIDQRVTESHQMQEALGKTARGLPGAVEQRTRLQLMRHLDQVQALVNLFQVVPSRSAAPRLGGWAGGA